MHVAYLAQIFEGYLNDIFGDIWDIKVQRTTVGKRYQLVSVTKLVANNFLSKVEGLAKAWYRYATVAKVRTVDDLATAAQGCYYSNLRSCCQPLVAACGSL